MADHEHTWETLENGSKICFECDQRMPVPPLYKYSFVVKGRYPDGNKAKMSGHIYDVEGHPWSAFEKAVEVCRAITPELIVDLSKPGQVTLTRNKKPYERIELTAEPSDLSKCPAENCCFCKEPTRWWVKGKDVACCVGCAPKYALAQVPTKAAWCAQNRRPNVAATN